MLRQIGFCKDLQSAPVGGYGLFKKLAALFSSAALSQFPKRGTQIFCVPAQS